FAVMSTGCLPLHDPVPRNLRGGMEPSPMNSIDAPGASGGSTSNSPATDTILFMLWLIGKLWAGVQCLPLSLSTYFSPPRFQSVSGWWSDVKVRLLTWTAAIFLRSADSPGLGAASSGMGPPTKPSAPCGRDTAIRVPLARALATRSRKSAVDMLDASKGPRWI